MQPGVQQPPLGRSVSRKSGMQPPQLATVVETKHEGLSRPQSLADLQASPCPALSAPAWRMDSPLWTCRCLPAPVLLRWSALVQRAGVALQTMLLAASHLTRCPLCVPFRLPA